MAGYRFADADGHGRRRRTVFHHIEVMIERCDLVYLRRRERHLTRECGQVRGREAAVSVLDAVQVLDQEIGTTRGIAQQRAYLAERPFIDFAPFRGRPQGNPADVPAASLAWRHGGKVGKAAGPRKSGTSGIGFGIGVGLRQAGEAAGLVARMLQEQRVTVTDGGQMTKMVAGVLFAVLVTGACGDTTGPELQLDASVRVLHAAPETPQLEVVLEGESRTRLEYAEVSERITVASGERRLQLLVQGETEALIDLDTLFESGTQYTVLAAGVGGEIEPIVLADDPTPADTGETRIRVVHAAPTAGTVDIYVSEPGSPIEQGTPVLTSVAFGDASEYMVLESRTYQVRVTMASGGALLIDLPLLVLSSTRALTIVMMDTMGSGPPHGLIALSDLR